LAVVTLRRREWSTELPSICMRCGAPAEVWIEKSFELSEQESIGFGPSGILLWLGRSLLRPKHVLRVPFCEAHRYHWSRRKLLIAGGLVVSLIVLIGGLGLSNVGGWPLESGFVVGLGVFVPWCVAAVIAHETAIHSTRITPEAITLKGVCGEFTQACEDRQRSQ
jgi:hypothetical protein